MSIAASEQLLNGEGQYGPIPYLLGSPSGPGVWFWDFSATDVTIFYWDGQSQLQSWNVLSGTSYAPPEASAGLTVDGQGNVWFGYNDTLFELDPTTADISTWSIPPPPTSAAESQLPFGLQGIQAVTNVAVGPTGRVAVALSSASGVEVLDPTTGSFSVIATPATAGTPVSVAWDQDGYLAVGLQSQQAGSKNSVVLVSPSQTQTVVGGLPDTSAIAAFSSSEFVVGSSQPYLVTEQGGSTPVVLSTVLIPNPGHPAPLPMNPEGQLVGGTSLGLLSFSATAASQSAATSSAVALSLPEAPCAYGEQGSTPATTSPQASTTSTGAGQLCPQGGFQAYAVDETGSIWVVPPGEPETIAELTAG
ncbi:MAG: hypothetical protein ACRD0Z_03785 [Acidimicrobiales bacterium]